MSADTAMIVAPALEHARPVGDYIEALVEAVQPAAVPATADEWIDAVTAAGLKLSISRDVYTGTPLNFSISPGERGYGAAGWHRLQPLIDQIGQGAIFSALHRRAVGDPVLELVKRARSYEASCAGNLHDDDDPRWAGFDRINDELLSAPVATTLGGVLSALEYGAAEVNDFDRCADGVLRAALGGLRNLLGVGELRDPLADLIAAYLAGNRRFNAHPDALHADEERNGAAIEETYGPSYEALKNDPPAPSTLRGVRAALKLLGDDQEGDEVCLPVARAACRFFENPPVARPSADPVFALIERHKALWAATEAMNSDDEGPEWTAAVDEAAGAMEELVYTDPTTLAGAAAMAFYVSTHPVRRGNYQDDSALVDTLGRALRALVP